MGGTIVDVPNSANKRRRRSSHVHFKEEEEIINPGIRFAVLFVDCSFVLYSV